MSQIIRVSRRPFLFKNWTKAKASRKLISNDDRLQIDKYRGNLDDFLEKVEDFERYLQTDELEAPEGSQSMSVDVTNRPLLAGKATPEGTMRFASRAQTSEGIPRMNFRKPILPLPSQKQFHLSTVALGTYLGLPDDATDFDQYIAAKELLLSGGVNVLDTAINYRCQRAERTLGAALATVFDTGKVSRDEVFVCSKNGYIPDDSHHGKSAAMLVEELIEDGLITKEDVAGEIHCMHPAFLEHQLEQSKKNLGLETIDLMYLHNSYESQAHFVKDDDHYFDRLAKAFEFYEKKREEGDIQYYGMATWLSFRAQQEEEKIYLSFQKTLELAEKIGGSNHGYRFVQAPVNVMMTEALVEQWQEFQDQTKFAAPDADPEKTILVVLLNKLKMNLIVSKPLLEGSLKDVKLPTITNVSDPIAKHLQLIRSLPPRCIISTACGMKEINNLNSNFEVIQREPLSRPEFMAAMKLK